LRYVKPTEEKGPDNSVCFGFGTSDDIVLPQDCIRSGWYVYDGLDFVVEPQVTCELVATDRFIPENIQAMVVNKRMLLDLEKMAIQEEVYTFC
jgi:hypothetical protein